MSTYADTEDKAAVGTADSLLERAKKCFKQAVDAEASQRQREQEDLRFQVPELQWDEAAKAARRGGTEGGIVSPARPMLSISKLDQPIQLILNQARAAKLGVNIHPVSEDADDDTAEVMQGIYRRIERDSNADQARLWALDRATKAGRGAYRVNTKYDEDAGETFDQEIVIERILHQDAVYFDPSAQRPDFSDGNWAFVAVWMPIGDFRREYPDAKFQLSSGGDFAEAVAAEPNWVKGDGDEKAVLVVEYWYKVQTAEVLKVKDRERKRIKIEVRRCTMTGLEVLEDVDWNGRYIPLIPVIGRELQPFESERRWVGMIGHAKDAQRFYNYSASTLVERMALEPKVPYVGYVGQFETDKTKWNQINTRNFPYVESDTVTVDGKPAALPQRIQLDQSGMSIAMQGLQASDDWIQANTSVYDPSLGRQNPREKSGRAILALQSQSDAGTSHYLASLADVSLAYEARVILDLIPHIYDRPGRITRILGGEDDSRSVMLNAPFTIDSHERPVAAQEGQQGAKLYNLKAGTYSISVSIGKSFQTRLEQGQTEIGEILSAQPALMPMLGATYFRFRDFPGAKEIADILKKVRDQQFPGLEEGKDGQPSPEQAQAQVLALQQQMQLMQAQLQGAMKALETEQAKQQATLQKAEMDNQAKVALAKIEQETAAHQLALKLQLEKMSQQFEGMQAALDRQHEMEQARFDAAHEVAMAAAGGNTVTRRREGGQEQGREAPDGQADGAGE